MKKTIVTILSSLLFLLSKAQVAEFWSLGSTTLEKDSKGNFSDVKKWRVQEAYIIINLNNSKIQFFSKMGLLDRDTFNLKKEIFIVSESTYTDETLAEFSGIDKLGRKCIVKLKPSRDTYKMQDGELRVEYSEHVEIYIIKNYRHKPIIISHLTNGNRLTTFKR